MFTHLHSIPAVSEVKKDIVFAEEKDSFLPFDRWDGYSARCEIVSNTTKEKVQKEIKEKCRNALTPFEFHLEDKKYFSDGFYDVDFFYLPKEFQKLCQEMCLFTNSFSKKTKYCENNGLLEILRKFEIIGVPAVLDYDEAWKPITDPRRAFYVYHAAAFNIGGNDFALY